MESTDVRLSQNLPFKKLLSIELFSKFADAMDNVIITLLVIQLTGSSLSTGLLLAITTIPGVIFSVIGGAIADIGAKKTILFLMTALQAIMLLFLAFLVKIGSINFALLCIILFILESFSRFYSPAFTALTVSVVPKGRYKQAVSLLTTAGSFVQMIGSAVCVPLVTFLGYVPALVTNAASYTCSSFLSITMRDKHEPEKQRDAESRLGIQKFWNTIVAGFRYTINHSVIMTMITCVSLLNFVLAWFDVALPFLLTDFIGVPVEYLGYLKSASTLILLQVP